MKPTRRTLGAAVCAAVLFAAVAARGEEADKPKGGPVELQGLKFRLVGPNAGGRVSRATGVPGDPLTYYAATASGGVWKSVDGGSRWASLFDDQPIASIGSIAVSPSSPNVVYVGSGEANIRGNVAPGNGIYKSTDGGKTWAHVWTQEGQIGTMIVHPQNPDVAFAAVLGHAFGPNPERGVYRTRDGGKTWQKILSKDSDTGASDVCFDPQNPNVLFAGLWQARRRPWELTSGGPGSGLYTSRDGGDTWKHLEGNGLPEGILGKIGVAVAPSDPRRVYALIEAEKGGLFRSDDGGEKWSRVNDHRALQQRAWYYSTLAIDPQNPEVVWFPQVPLLKTIDGGKTVKRVPGIRHGDNHDVWIDPKNPRRLILANDGGVEVSVNGGETWRAAWLPISQFYHVAADNSVPYRVSGAMQDLGTAWGPTDTLDKSGIRVTDWYGIGGGEAGHTAHDPDDPGVAYAGEYLGIFTRYDHKTRQARNVSPYPNNLSGHGDEDGRYRFQWTAPILVSPFDGKTVYYGGNVVFRTRDGGQTWAVISPDLTRNDKSKQKWSGGPITGDNTGVEFYCTVFALAESPKEKGLLWAGSDDGLVHVSRDGGAHWTNVTAAMPGFPEWGTVSIIEPSPHDAATAYVVVKNQRMDDMRPYLWKTSDYGKTWKRLGPGLPQNVFLHSVREDPVRKGLLYLGTELGLMYSTDDGATFTPLKLNLPTVAVHDLVVKGNDLVLATHGRSLWVFGHLPVLRALGPEVVAKDVYLFPPAAATRWRMGERTWGEKGMGENPPRGAVVAYFLKKKVEGEGEITLEVLDSRGNVVKKLTSKPAANEWPEGDPDGDDEDKPYALPADAGVNAALWDLTLDGALPISKARLDSGKAKEGPLALPGSYTVRLTAGGQALSAPLEVKPDPRLSLSPADLLAQMDFVLGLREDLSRLTRTVEQIRSVREQVQSRDALLKDNAAAAELRKSGEALVAQCDSLERRLHNPTAQVSYDILAMKGGTQLYSKLAPLYTWAHEADGVPTQGMKELAAEHRKELDQLTSEWQALVSGGIAAFNAKARELSLGFVLVGAGK
jgi:photosystem II stability/assembly factor-like uncharacterized protein